MQPTKWADYLIFQVRHSPNGAHIEKVKAHKDEGATISPALYEFSRADVVRYLEGGVTFATVVKNNQGTWNRGTAVEIQIVHNSKFLKTKPDSTPQDNLGGLPTF